MFRPAYFVILFAVVLCVNALPEPQATRAPPTTRVPQVLSGGPRVGRAAADGKATSAKGDLDTDATEYWRYTYNYHVPSWNIYDPVAAGRVYGWPTVYY